MAETAVEVQHDEPHAHDEHHGPQGFLKYIWSTDHKMIAMQYMFTGMFMAVIGGFMAYVFRMQLAFPGINVPLYGQVSPGEYNALITNHGTIMIFWVAMPAIDRGLRELPDPTHDRCGRHGVPAHQPSFLPDLLPQCRRAFGVSLCRGWRLRGRVDSVSAPIGGRGVQPNRSGFLALADRGGAGVRRLPVGWHQLHHHVDELPGAGHEGVRRPARLSG